MRFVENQFYHVYNQGNNRRKVFFSNGDYELFLYKIRLYILPYSDIVAYCLMPNHYHLLLYVKKVSMDRGKLKHHIEEIQREFTHGQDAINNLRPTRLNTSKTNEISLHDSLAIIQRSYTRRINLKKAWSGSLFRTRYNIKQGWPDKFIGVLDSEFYDGYTYLHNCIKYIHNNPVKADLCKNDFEWKYSSAGEYEGICERGLCNKKLIERITL